MKQKKWFEKLALLFFVFSLLTPGLGGLRTLAASTDYSGHWAEEQISDWMVSGLITGYPDGSFKPDRAVTRGEFITLANRAFALTETAPMLFKDLNEDQWAYPEVLKALKAGYISGYEDSTIREEQPVRRQEAAVMVAALAGLKNKPVEAGSFSDVKFIAEWSLGAIGAAVEKGILSGYEDGSFRPEGSLTRAEAVVMLTRAAEVQSKKEYDHAGIFGPETGTEIVQGNAVISAPGVTLRNLIIEGDLLLAKSIGEGDILLEQVEVKGEVVIHGGGAHSVHLNNSSLATVTVDKQDGEIRLALEGNTTIERLIIRSIAAIETATDTIIRKAELHAVVKVTGQGRIELAEISAEGKGTTFEKQPAAFKGAGAPVSIVSSTGTVGGTAGGTRSEGGGAAPSQPTVINSVYGSVYDAATSQPLHGVVVTVTGVTYTTFMETKEDGSYLFSNIPYGSYTIKAAKIGFQSTVSPAFKVEENSLVSKEIQLQPAPQGNLQIDGEAHIIRDEMRDDLSNYIPYRLVNSTGQPVEKEEVEWSLRFPFAPALPYWNESYTERETNREVPYGMTIDPHTGVLHTGWRGWIGDFQIVAKSSDDGAILAEKTVRFSYNNIERVDSSNGEIRFYFLEEPDWYYYESNGEQKRYYSNVDSVSADTWNYNGEGMKELPIISGYDEAANAAFFRFTPFAQGTEEQQIIIQLGYIESTFITYVILTVPAE